MKYPKAKIRQPSTSDADIIEIDEDQLVGVREIGNQYDGLPRIEKLRAVSSPPFHGKGYYLGSQGEYEWIIVQYDDCGNLMLLPLKKK